MNIQVCRETSDAVALYLPQRLYLKPFAKLNISIQLPTQKVHGKSISNWELMEKLRKMIQPDNFSLLKVSKHSSEVIRFEAELECRDKLGRVMARLDGRIVQLNEYPDALKVRVTETKYDFPSRHSWDSFFQEATDMDEMKPGERPDTIHISNLPIRWFVHKNDRDEDALPSENIFKRVFEKFGSIRQVDVPAADPFRMQMKAAMRGITTPSQESALYFEGYVQYNEYVSFVRCMDTLRGKKLLRRLDDVAEWCGIKVDFDKTKHMTDAAVKRRAIVRERLSARQQAKDEEEKAEKDRIAKKEVRERQKIENLEREKLEKMREREERRKKKQLAKLIERENVDLNSKVAEEQRRLVRAQKKLQAIRLIEELFKRIELRPELSRNNGFRSDNYYSVGERNARARCVDKLKQQCEEAVEEQRNYLKSALDGRIVIRSALETRKPKRDSSISSISSEEGRAFKRIKSEKLTTPEREREYNKVAAAGMYGVHPYGFGYPFGAVPPAYAYPHQTASLYYPMRGGYFGAESYAPRRGFRGRGRGRGRGGPRMPYFDGPDASQQYYKYFKKLAESEGRNEHDDRVRSRSHSRSRSRSRSRRRSYTRSRSRSRRRSYTRSRSRSRSRARRDRSRSRRSRSRRTSSRSRRSRSHHSRSRSRKRSRSRSRRSRSRSKSKQRSHSEKRENPDIAPNVDGKTDSPVKRRSRSKSWSLPKNEEKNEKSWSTSPKEN